MPVGQCEQMARGKCFDQSHDQHCRATDNAHCKTNHGQAAGTSHSHQHPSGKASACRPALISQSLLLKETE